MDNQKNAQKNKISELIESSLDSIRELVDANTIIGEPILTAVGTTIIPISKVSVGFAGGGNDYAGKNSAAVGKNNFGGGGGDFLRHDPADQSCDYAEIRSGPGDDDEGFHGLADVVRAEQPDDRRLSDHPGPDGGGGRGVSPAAGTVRLRTPVCGVLHATEPNDRGGCRDGRCDHNGDRRYYRGAV